MRNISFQGFCEIFNMLLTVTGKADPDQMLSKTYYELLAATNPTVEELFNAAVAWVDTSNRLPTGTELKQIIWDERKRSQPALSGAIAFDEGDPRQNRLNFLAPVYKGQGDTAFYRSLLNQRSPFDPPVTHQDVVDYCGGEVAAVTLSFKPSKVFASIGAIASAEFGQQPTPLPQTLQEMIAVNRRRLHSNDPILRNDAIAWAMGHEDIKIVTDRGGNPIDFQEVEF